MRPSPPPPQPTADRRVRRASMAACTLGSATVFLDASMVPVALPSLAHELGGGLALQQWVTVAYLLTLGALVLVGGSLSDLFGRRRVFAVGALGFAAASLLCAAAPNAAVLIAARAVQGVAGALLVPSALALLGDAFAPAQRGKAIGAWTAWTGLATVLGPLAGGVLVATVSWRGLFVLSAGPALSALWFLRAIPPRPARHARVDSAGALLATLAFGGLSVALVEQPQRGWSDLLVLGALIVASIGLVSFVFHERRSVAPMLPLGLFHRRNFSVATLGTVLLYAAFNASWFFTVVFLQQVAGYTALQAGMALSPIPVLIFALSRTFGGLADRHGARRLIAAGSLLSAAGLALLVRVGAGAAYAVDVLPAVAVLGLGLAMAAAPLTAVVLGDVSAECSGIASGINNAAARISGLLAIAALGVVLTAHFPGQLEQALATRGVNAKVTQAVNATKPQPLAGADGGQQTPEVTQALAAASVSCFHLVMISCAALAALGGLVGLTASRRSLRAVPAAGCPGGALCGASQDLAVADAEPRSVIQSVAAPG